LTPDGRHNPVLLEEAMAALAIKPGGIYVDATFGRGGHSRHILARLSPAGRLVALDRDPDAEAVAGTWRDPRFRFHRAWFSELPQVLDADGVAEIDGLLLDLGISSPQIDDPRRGFSLRADGPLDMRMDPARGSSAAEWLASVTERELRGVIADYGEERFAQQIARAVVAARALEPIVRTRQLAAIVAKAVGARRGRDRSQDPATRTFQALRIYINQELSQLSLALERALPRLASGGRLAVISFHSLEDRLVKQFFRRHSEPYGGDTQLARLPIAERALPVPPLRLVGRAIRPCPAEIAANPRSRSATLRAAERTGARLA
jgi:16S rRNA (cytosine1402-N4)-methyltransferase